MLTAERLREVLHYDPETGVFTWRRAPGYRRDLDGTVAGTIRSRRYRRVWVAGRNYQAGRLAWFYVHGRWPHPEVDHIDRDPLNDRLSNLREATRSVNCSNRRSWKWGEEVRAAFCERNGYECR